MIISQLFITFVVMQNKTLSQSKRGRLKLYQWAGETTRESGGGKPNRRR